MRRKRANVLTRIEERMKRIEAKAKAKKENYAKLQRDQRTDTELADRRRVGEEVQLQFHVDLSQGVERGNSISTHRKASPLRAGCNRRHD